MDKKHQKERFATLNVTKMERTVSMYQLYEAIIVCVFTII